MYTFNKELTVIRVFRTAHSSFLKQNFFNNLGVNARIKRLIAVAFVRDLLAVEVAEGRSYKIVFDRLLDSAEKYADGEIIFSDLRTRFDYNLWVEAAEEGVLETPVQACNEDCNMAAAYCSDFAIRKRQVPLPSSALRSQAIIIFDAIGSNIWSFDPSWRTATAVQMAAGMYETKDFSAMPILADALQDAGCCEEELLTRMRKCGKNWYRGCWVVDHLLKKR